MANVWWCMSPRPRCSAASPSKATRRSRTPISRPSSQSKPRGTLQRATVQADVGRIVEAYRHAGRDDVSVVPKIIDRGNDRVDLVFVVTEGKKTTVRQINFVGNNVFGKRQLAAVIKTSATNVLSFLTGGDVYDPDRVAPDREQLRLYYRSKGYADASVTSASAEYDPATQGFALTFSIDEGPLYHFGDINVVCNVPGLTRETPSSARWRDRRGIRRQRAGQDHRSSRDRTGEARFSLRAGQPRITRDAAAQRIDIAFMIDQGPRTYVERIEIHGNTPHPRLRDPARIRYWRRRRLQQEPDRSRRAAAEEL